MLASPSPLKTALASEVFLWPNESSLAVPSDKCLRGGVSGDQRVKEQVMMTVKRHKSRSSTSSPGSMYETVADYNNMNYNNNANQYSKYQSANSIGYQYNGTLKRDQQRFSSYSQADNWGQHRHMSYASPLSPGSDFDYKQTLKSSRSEPDLTGPDVRATLRRQNQYNQIFYSYHSTQQKKRGPMTPARTPSSLSTVMDTRDEFDAGGMTLDRAVELLGYPDDKFQMSGANYIQHACFQDENAKNLVYQSNGISKLINLLQSPNENVQQATAGALRNLVFKNSANKLETSQKGGTREAVSLLKRTSHPDIQKQLTDELVKEALPVLNERVVIPYSGWSERSMSNQNCMLDPEVFFNATGCLR
uniref:Uncharacterized protein n=1 Tax=Xenopus tropicalis TaxID=8364 RepID=A0A6I8S990_XENTR